MCETTILLHRPLSLASAYSAKRIIPPGSSSNAFSSSSSYYSSSIPISNFRSFSPCPRSLFPRAYIEQSESINFLVNSIPDPQYTRRRVGTPHEL